MKNPIACCGLNCEECEAYKATINNDQALREKVAKEWSEKNDCEITPDMINCEGCLNDGVKTKYCTDVCYVRYCCTTREYRNCGDCATKELCEHLKKITDNNPQAMKTLNKVDKNLVIGSLIGLVIGGVVGYFLKNIGVYALIGLALGMYIGNGISIKKKQK